MGEVGAVTAPPVESVSETKAAGGSKDEYAFFFEPKAKNPFLAQDHHYDLSNEINGVLREPLEPYIPPKEEDDQLSRFTETFWFLFYFEYYLFLLF